MLVAALAKTGVTGPVVSCNRGTCGNGTLDEAAERVGAAIGHDGKPNAPGVTTALTLVELCARFALANLDGAGDQHLVSDAPAFSSRPTTDIAFIDFDVLTRPAANPILIWSNGSMQPCGVCSCWGMFRAHGTRVSWCRRWCGG